MVRSRYELCWCTKLFKRNIARLQFRVSYQKKFHVFFHWKWNIPQASHQNGVVESLIKSERQALDASSKNQTLTEEQWRTYLAEVTYLTNGRPLYPSSVEIWETPVAQSIHNFLIDFCTRGE